MDTYRAIITLRAVRHFTDRFLPDKILSRILQAGRWAGSAKNVEPWHFIVVREHETLEQLAECGKYASHMKEAAGVVVIVTEPGVSVAFDSGRAAQNMMLTAWAYGVGSCIATLHNGSHARALLDVPGNLQIQLAISFGYPKSNAPLTIEGRPREEILAHVGRRPLSEIAHWEKW